MAVLGAAAQHWLGSGQWAVGRRMEEDGGPARGRCHLCPWGGQATSHGIVFLGCKVRSSASSSSASQTRSFSTEKEGFTEMVFCTEKGLGWGKKP